MKAIKLTFCITLIMLLASNVSAHEGHDHGPPLAVSVAVDAQGRLWRASVKDGFVLVDSALSLTQVPTFSKPIKVNLQAQKIGVDSEARPKIAIAKNGYIYVTWTQALPTPYSGYIWFARSIDGGKSFEAVKVVHQDKAEITHRFDALSVTPSGRIYVAWVDKRDLIQSKKLGKPYDGAAIYYAISDNQGTSFQPEQKLADSSCECCRIAMIADEKDRVVLMWRHLFEGGVRDHAIATLNLEASSPAVHRASFGHWKVDACPHHGPALARGGEWGYHMAWFDGGEKSGLFYARMDGDAWVTSPAKRFGNASQQAGHPALASQGESVWLAWKEISEQDSTIQIAFSSDGGRSWEPPKVVARTQGKSDYPQLISKNSELYLVWNTQLDGLQFLKVTP